MNRTPEMPPSLGGALDLSPLVNKAAPQRAANPGQNAQPSTGGDPSRVVDVPALVLDVTDETFGSVAQLSTVVPVVIDLWAEWCQPCKTLGPILERVTESLGGRVLLAKVDVDSNPQLAQAFQAQSIPTVAALVAGQPVALFQGAIPEQQVVEVFSQLLALAAQQGVTGRVNAQGGAADTESTEPPLPPLHQEAFDAIERGDYSAAVAAYEKAITQNPRDTEAQSGLTQVRLLQRLEGKSLDVIRATASAEPLNVDAQLDVADLDVSGGHVSDAFSRLLDLFQQSDEDARLKIRERLLELFDVVGPSDPRVLEARRQLTSLLF